MKKDRSIIIDQHWLARHFSNGWICQTKNILIDRTKFFRQRSPIRRWIGCEGERCEEKKFLLNISNHWHELKWSRLIWVLSHPLVCPTRFFAESMIKCFYPCLIDPSSLSLSLTLSGKKKIIVGHTRTDLPVIHSLWSSVRRRWIDLLVKTSIIRCRFSFVLCYHFTIWSHFPLLLSPFWSMSRSAQQEPSTTYMAST